MRPSDPVRHLTSRRSGWDLLEIGDDVTVSQDALLGLVVLEEGQIIVGPVTLADGATLDIRAGMGPHTYAGRNSTHGISVRTSISVRTRRSEMGDSTTNGKPSTIESARVQFIKRPPFLLF